MGDLGVWPVLQGHHIVFMGSDGEGCRKQHALAFNRQMTCRRSEHADVARLCAVVQMAQYYELVVYTDQLPTYADPILDRLDPQRFIQYRLYRDSTQYINGKHVRTWLFSLLRPCTLFDQICSVPWRCLSSCYYLPWKRQCSRMMLGLRRWWSHPMSHHWHRSVKIELGMHGSLT